MAKQKEKHFFEANKDTYMHIYLYKYIYFFDNKKRYIAVKKRKN